MVSSVTSAISFVASADGSCAATTFSFTCVRRSVTVSAAVRAVATLADPVASASAMPLKPSTSDCMVCAMAQTEALSFAVATDLPVEISFWVMPRFLLIDVSVCNATIAELFVRILDILLPSEGKFHLPCYTNAATAAVHAPSGNCKQILEKAAPPLVGARHTI